MAYIGKSPTGTGVRQRYYFTATGGETSLSGADDNGLTLSYSDGAYVDVLLNGIELVAGTDYNTTTANTIAGLSALATSDVVTVTVYDIFTVADTVSASNGGTFSGNVVFNGNTTGLDLNGTEMVLDADGDTSITADTDDQIDFKTGGSDRVTINSSGNVGIGTTSPSATLEVDAATTNGLVQIGQLQFKNSSGNFTSGTDGIHMFPFSDGNIYHDNYDGGFSWRTGASSTQIFKVTSTGKTTIGNPSYGGNGYTTTLDIRYAGGGTQYGVNMLPNADGANSFSFFNAAGTLIGSISNSASATTYYTSSDYRLKENDVDMTGAIERVKQLQPKRFNFIVDADKTVDGFMAHEVQTVVPEAISGTKDAMRNEEYEVTPAVLDDNGHEITPAVISTRSVPDYQGIDQSKLVPLLTGALQEAIAKIETLEAKVTALENA